MAVVPVCRAAEILYSLVMGHFEDLNDFPTRDQLYHYLAELRCNSSLLQHHDAITGTAKRNVVQSYLEM